MRYFIKSFNNLILNQLLYFIKILDFDCEYNKIK